MIELELPEDFWITSDTWFGRPQILDVGNRKFKNVDEMNDVLIKNWNERITNDDTVIHLGNFAWDSHTAIKVLNKLNGTIIFMLGNSDIALEDVFHHYDNVDIIENEILTLPNSDLVLCHYPLEVWDGKESGTIHIHGHCIFSHKTDLTKHNRFNICCDFWDYSPVKLSTLKEIINLK